MLSVSNAIDWISNPLTTIHTATIKKEASSTSSNASVADMFSAQLFLQNNDDEKQVIGQTDGLSVDWFWPGVGYCGRNLFSPITSQAASCGSHSLLNRLFCPPSFACAVPLHGAEQWLEFGIVPKNHHPHPQIIISRRGLCNDSTIWIFRWNLDSKHEGEWMGYFLFVGTRESRRKTTPRLRCNVRFSCQLWSMCMHCNNI